MRDSKASISLCEFCSYDVEATVRKNSSTYERWKDMPSGACRVQHKLDDKEEWGDGRALWVPH